MKRAVGYVLDNRAIAVRSFLAAVSCLVVPAVQAQTYVCGDICNDTWTPAGSPYIATCTVRVIDTVEPSCTLTIQAGTEVRFQSGTRLAVYADDSLEVFGTEVAPVTFTSDSPTPAPGNWTDIYVGTDAVATIHHANIRYATTGINSYATSLTVEESTIEYCGDSAIYVRSGPATITNVTVQNNNFGLRSSAGTNLQVTGSTITQNNTGLYLGGGGTVIFRDNSILGNGSYDLNAYGDSGTYTSALDFRRNWWGTTDPAVIRSHIYDSANYESGRPVADWCEWLDGESGAPVTDYECPDLAVCGETDVWDVTARPYLLTSEVVVCPTGRLEVGPGVHVQAIRHTGLNIRIDGGQVEVDATSGPPATFTTNDPSPSPGDWSGFKVYSSTGPAPSVVMRNASIEYGTVGIDAKDDAVLDLENVTVRDNSSYGIHIRDGQLTLAGVTVRDNHSHGMYVYGDVNVSASGCLVTGNSQYGVQVSSYAAGSGAFAFNDSSIFGNGATYEVYASVATDPDSTVLDFRGNWWGTAAAATIRSYIRDHAQDARCPIVDWCGFLDDEPGAGSPARNDAECPDLVVCTGTVRWDVPLPRYYLLTSDVYVCPVARLEVGPGVEVRAVRSSTIEFLVDGELDADGSPSAPVAFTSDAPAPQNEDWWGFRLRNASSMWMRNASVRYTANGVHAEDSAEVTLENAAVTDGRWDGMGLYDSAIATLTNVDLSRNQRSLYGYGNPTLHATGCTITANRAEGMYIDGASGDSPSIVIAGSSLHSNDGYDLFARNFAGAATSIVWAPDNWWGTTDVEQIRDEIYDQEDISTSPLVYFRPFSLQCAHALAGDYDGDGAGDFEDNCPVDPNVDQTDTDADGMGDPCDPAPGAPPTGDCDGIDDVLDGYADADGDGFGDPCDFQPTRADSYPGATELCDARDNDGDPTTWAIDELTDLDLDRGIDCADCDTADPEIHACICENCTNLIDDDCDYLVDGDDASCTERDVCVVLADGVGDPEITLHTGACGGATLTGLYDVMRGDLGQCALAGGSVDLGQVACVANDLTWDRVTDTSADPNPGCDDMPVVFYVAKDASNADYGAASSGERRDTMTGIPCP